MGAPQIIMIVLIAIEISVASLLHGQSKGQYNFGATFVAQLILVALLIWGGFFK